MKKLILILFLFPLLLSGQHHMMHTLAGQGGGTTLLSGLISCWELDEASGSTAYDEESYANLATTGATPNQTGLIDKSYLFDATTEKLLAANNSLFNFEYSDAFSVSMWVYRNVNNITRLYFAKQDLSTNSKGFDMWQNTSNYINVDIVNYAPNTRLITVYTSSISTINSWINVTVTYSGNGLASGVKIYVNGTSQTLTVYRNNLSSNTIQNTAIFEVGNRAGAFNFNGKIDQTAVWNRALTQEEITTLYNSGNGLAYSNW